MKEKNRRLMINGIDRFIVKTVKKKRSHYFKHVELNVKS